MAGGVPWGTSDPGLVGRARCRDALPPTATVVGTYGPGTPSSPSPPPSSAPPSPPPPVPGPSWRVWLLLAPVGVLLAVVDFRVKRLPDVLTLPLAGAAPALLGLVGARARARR